MWKREYHAKLEIDTNVSFTRVRQLQNFGLMKENTSIPFYSSCIVVFIKRGDIKY